MNRYLPLVPTLGIITLSTLAPQPVLAEEAIADYNEAIRLNPQDAVAYYNRGFSYRDLGDRKRAIDSFQQAADLYQQQGNTEWYENALDRTSDLQ